MSDIERLRREQDGYLAAHGLVSKAGTSTNLIPFHYVIGERPGRPWMVFLHGFPDSWWVWRDQIKAFASDHSILALDLPGFGRAFRPLGLAELDIQGVIVPEICRLLLRTSGPIHLVGHDLGALAAWYVALELQRLTANRLKRLTVFGIGHPSSLLGSLGSPVSWVRARHWFVFALPRPIPETLLRAADWYLLRRLTRFHPEVDAWRPELARSGALTTALNWFRGNLLFSLRLPDGIDPQLRTQVVAIRTEGDLMYSSRAQLEGSRRYVDGPFRLVHLEDLSHWAMRDDPDLVNHLLRPL